MSEVPVTPWPAMPGALVVARFAQIHGDGTDADDRPDWIAPVGTELRFVPSITGPLVYDPAGAKIIVEAAPFRAIVDADGYAVARDGGHPIKLAPTDDPLMSRTGWLWTCSWAGGKVSLPAPSGGVINLADFIIAPPGNPVVEEWVGRIPELIDAAGSLVGIASVASDAGDMVVTLTNGEAHRFPMPPGVPGHSPVVGLDGDRLTVDGLPVGGSLRGPAGHSPEVVVDGDIITVDGQSTVPLTGPPVATRWEGTALVVGDSTPVDLKGAKGDPGPSGGPIPAGGEPGQVPTPLAGGGYGWTDMTGGDAETPSTVTRGAATTLGTLTLTRLGRTCTLTADGIRAAGTSTALGSLPTADDRPLATTLGSGWLTDTTAANAWGVTVGADGSLTLTATPAAATILSGTVEWRTA